MRNLTISLEERVARWARIAAAERDVSVSRFVADLLRAKMEEDAEYERAMIRSLGREARQLKAPGARYPARDDLYE